MAKDATDETHITVRSARRTPGRDIALSLG
jgi:hypothetical protein